MKVLTLCYMQKHCQKGQNIHLPRYFNNLLPDNVQCRRQKLIKQVYCVIWWSIPANVSSILSANLSAGNSNSP